MDRRKNNHCRKQKESSSSQEKHCDRRQFLKGAATVAALGGAAMLTGCGTGMLGSKEELSLQWKEYFKKNYRGDIEALHVGGYNVFMDCFEDGRHKDRLCEEEESTGKSQSITETTFSKYVTEAKKNIKKSV